MTDLKKSYLNSYEENERITSEVELILWEKIPNFKKINRLAALRKKTAEPISRSHIDYYLKKLKSENRNKLFHLISKIIVLCYLIFTLLRVFWYYHPGENPLPETSFTISNFIVLLYVIPVIFIVNYIIRRIVRNKE